MKHQMRWGMKAPLLLFLVKIIGNISLEIFVISKSSIDIFLSLSKLSFSTVIHVLTAYKTSLLVSFPHFHTFDEFSNTQVFRHHMLLLVFLRFYLHFCRIWPKFNINELFKYFCGQQGKRGVQLTLIFFH